MEIEQHIPTLRNLSPDEVRGKRVMVRISANVPVTNGVIQDDSRLVSNLETIEYLSGLGAKVILVGHIWGDETKTLQPVFDWFQDHFSLRFITEPDLFRVAEEMKLLEDGDIVLLENIRLHAGEMQNDADFARTLAGLADLYVNNAFPDSHRNHASIVGIPRHIPGCLGFHFEKETKELKRAFGDEHPFLLVVGGAKFKTKIPLIEAFMDKADTIFIGGAIMNVYLQARGCEIGQSLIPEKSIEIRTLEEDGKVYLPRDVVSSASGERSLQTCDTLGPEDKIQDIGPEALDDLISITNESAFVVWNGPLGNYEEGFTETTEAYAKALAKSAATSIIGGGDTLAVVSKLGIEEKFSFISTGGGAMLEYLTHHTLPGIEALRS